jgi:hypothetical protein
MTSTASGLLLRVALRIAQQEASLIHTGIAAPIKACSGSLKQKKFYTAAFFL